MSKNFEYDVILSLTDKMQNNDYAKTFYSAICNMRWQNIKDPKNIYSCTWRYAGGMVAEIRSLGEYYLDFYCSGKEGIVTKEIENDLNGIGWKKLEWEKNEEE